MALRKDEDLKTYYSIKEVAEMIKVTESTLRYWETEFPNIKPRTTGNKVRQYTKEDIEQLRQVYNLVKVRGFKIAAARKMFHVNRTGVEKSSKIIDNLVQLREDLTEMRKAIDKLQ